MLQVTGLCPRVLLIIVCCAGFAQNAASGYDMTSSAVASPLTEDRQTVQSVASPDSLIGDIRRKLEETNEALAQASAKSSVSASSGVALPAETVESELVLQQTVRFYQRQIDILLKLQSLRQSGAQLSNEMANWSGLPTQPPYSFRMVDELREDLRNEQDRIAALTLMSKAIEQETERRKERLKDSDERLRQANEALETSGASDPRLAWLRDLAVQRNHMDQAGVEGIQIEKQANDEELAEARQQLDFIRMKLIEASKNIAYPSSDRDLVRTRLAAERQRLRAELEAELPLLENSRALLDAATAELDHARKARTDGEEGQGRLAELERKAEMARETSENSDVRYQSLNRLLDSVKMRLNVYESRWSLADSAKNGGIGQAYDEIARIKAQMKPLREYLEQRLKLTADQDFTVEKRLSESADATSSNYDRQLRDLYLEREANYRRMLWGTGMVEELVDYWKQDLDIRRMSEPWTERFQDWKARFSGILSDIWAFELFAVEDSIEVEGRKITGKRSVTLGKVVMAMLILVAGLWLAVKISRLGERIAVNRGGVEASAARIARRWLLFVVGVILLMTSLVMVKIPLTVFAFTGGALAIGAGFGMQNLLKNLISGLMLLAERPFRPGDLVEVRGIRGQVMDIGVRSSHIRDLNGIETVIPNSTFVEENVTNWTLSNRSVRIVVKLAVAYGTQVQKMNELLLEVANRHGLVLKEPAPQVLFEDFGSDALQFGLYVWVEIKPGMDWLIVASDLRYMINKTMSANGIVMAFPQRDVHVNVEKPVEIRLVRDRKAREFVP